MEDLNLPLAERDYILAVVDALRDVCGSDLLHVFLVGSASYGAYQPGISDIDMQAVVSDSISETSILTIAARLSHSQIPCPARLLEFVLYTRSAAGTSSERPHWSLNLNTGRVREHDLVQLQPDPDGGQHWYLLDLANARELGRTLYGSVDIAHVFAAPESAWVLRALYECVAWFAEHEPNNPSAVLNACRAWRWALVQAWGSKVQGAKWALKRPDLQPEHRTIVQAALDIRLNSSNGDAQSLTSSFEAKHFLDTVAEDLKSRQEP